MKSLEDNLYKLLSTYKRVPDWAKSVIAAPFKIFPRTVYLGNHYKIYYETIKELEFASKEEIEEYQWLKLKNLLYHCYATVPYYQDKWNEYGINIDKIKDFNDFKKTIPLLAKKEIQDNPEAFISKAFSKKDILTANTGGSTGKPLKLFYLKGSSRAAEWAHMHMLWSRVGYNPKSRLARIRGDYIGRNRIHSYDPWRNMLILSSFNINNETAEKYFALMRKYKIEFINAYPSSLYNLIQVSGVSRVNIPTLKAVLLGSENVLDYQINKIKEFFNIDKVFFWYGHAELCNLGGNCENSNDYHFFPSYGYTEFLKTNSINDTTIENVVEIVGTSFINPLMPLIRYKTEDYGIEKKENCTCGRNHLLLSKVIGREQEIAIGFKNTKITLTALVFGRHHNYLNHIVNMQIINTSPGELLVKVITKNSFTNKHKNEIINSLSETEGMPFNTKVEIAETLSTTPNGKHRFLIREF